MRRFGSILILLVFVNSEALGSSLSEDDLSSGQWSSNMLVFDSPDGWFHLLVAEGAVPKCKVEEGQAGGIAIYIPRHGKHELGCFVVGERQEQVVNFVSMPSGRKFPLPMSEARRVPITNPRRDIELQLQLVSNTVNSAHRSLEEIGRRRMFFNVIGPTLTPKKADEVHACFSRSAPAINEVELQIDILQKLQTMIAEKERKRSASATHLLQLPEQETTDHISLSWDIARDAQRAASAQREVLNQCLSNAYGVLP